MNQFISARVEKIKVRYLLLLFPLVFIFKKVVNDALDRMYAKSLYPVPFYKGQMTFNASELAGYYRFMVEHGSLSIYLQTQWFDFVFIAATFLMHGAVGLLMWKLHLNHRINRRLAAGILFSGLAAPVFDVLENAVSFYFIAYPNEITNPLTILYSTFAAAKFALFGVTYVGVTVSAASWLWMAVVKSLRLHSRA
ncbi:hypothetical protein [Paenibacillus hexagrammi]|uniref:Integral membrane protein n=1 Tax=Paenibacillus hexagrammi TaxID=2908839 RepID=A0ABY3SK64_9BACL|nr:hypothetical protein [Paenibacillus sp. YPD9-1]UJF33535.1 hypothetical protein L0M14_29240 [Paenibacillus sp. YPD9-1]